MVVEGTLYTFPESCHGQKVSIAANYSGAKIEVCPDFVFGKTNKSAEFKKHFPTGKVPAFVTKTEPKVYLSEGNAISYFVANDDLRGLNDIEKAQVLQWMNFADSEIVAVSNALSFPCLEKSLFNEQMYKSAETELVKIMSALESQLESFTYLVGERVTLADISVFCCISRLFTYYFDPKARNVTYPCTSRWFNTILNQPNVRNVVKSFEFCEKNTFAESEGDLEVCANPKKEKAVPKEKKAKEQVKVAKNKNIGNDEEEEPVAVKEPPSPFASLPAGKFDMNAFKRCYSNEDEKVSVPYFWEHFDAEHYSIWFAQYKYTEELQKIFMSCNLVNGMFQRLEKMRAQSFASVCVFGTDNDNTISGVWVWRGHDLAFKLSPDWQIDYESYDWKKLDPKDESDKKLVNQYLTWTGTDNNGRQFNQGKIFK